MSSWQNVASWYNNLVSQKGHFFHQNLIIPKSLELLNLKAGDSILDLACGQGVLAGSLPSQVNYYGVDLSTSLITFAKNKDQNPDHQYQVADITANLTLAKSNFTHAILILALQNIENPQKVLGNTQKNLATNGKLLLVLNHPCFRIPRFSGWRIDPQNKIQSRLVNHYLSLQKIPINIHPQDKKGPIVWSFHFSLETISKCLKETGFVIEVIEEWISPKKSAGKFAKMENLARNEIPLFMAILGRKV